jgi:hypothetical protein
MMEIDRVSEILGAVQADIAYIKKIVEHVDEKTTATSDIVIAHENKITALFKITDEIKPVIKKLDDDFNKRKGISIAVGFLSGVLGSLIVLALNAAIRVTGK